MLGVVVVAGERRKALGQDRSENQEIAPELMRNIPEDLRSIVPLLSDEDLKTFFDLLLGSVLKRGSFQIKRKREEREAAARAEEEAAAKAAQVAAEKAAAEQAAQATAQSLAQTGTLPGVAPATGAMPQVSAGQTGLPPTDVLDITLPPPTLDGGPTLSPTLSADESEPNLLQIDMDALEIDFMGDANDSQPVPAAPPSPNPNLPASQAMPAMVLETPPSGGGTDLEGKLHALKKLQSLLKELTSSSNAHRKSFDLVYRFLKQKKMVPPTMLRSTAPFLEALKGNLVPQLAELAHYVEVPPSYHKITEYCEAITRSKSPADIKKNVPVNMERILHLLDGLNSATAKWVEDCASALEEAAFGADTVGGGDVLGSIDI